MVKFWKVQKYVVQWQFMNPYTNSSLFLCQLLSLSTPKTHPLATVRCDSLFTTSFMRPVVTLCISWFLCSSIVFTCWTWFRALPSDMWLLTPLKDTWKKLQFHATGWHVQQRSLISATTCIVVRCTSVAINFRITWVHTFSRQFSCAKLPEVQRMNGNFKMNTHFHCNLPERFKVTGTP